MKSNYLVPVGVSSRHVHLSKEHISLLFGEDYELTPDRELQPGYFAAKERVDIIGPKSAIKNVRVMSPPKEATQVEVSITDCYKLGIKPEIRNSGDLKGSPGVIISGPRGKIQIDEGVICAARHIHISPVDADKMGVKDGEKVSVKTNGVRETIYANVLIRVSDNMQLELHIDTDEANAANLKQKDMVTLIRNL